MRIRAQAFHDLCALARGRVSLMVAASAAFGYLLARPEPDVGLAWTAGGTMLLAWACSAWNQAQERDLDALIPRTRNRPLPRGRMGVRPALAVGLVWYAAAVLCLYRVGGPAPALMAVVVVGLYNGLYTPLKRVSGFALLIGAAVGALPPVLGRLCAGARAFAPESALLYGVYLLWQVPHFWLRAERDSRAYAAAQLPVPPAQFAGGRYRRLLRLWFHAYAAAVLLLPVFPLLHSGLARAVLALLGMALFVCGSMLLRPGGGAPQRAAALRLADGSLAVTVLVLALDSVAA